MEMLISFVLHKQRGVSLTVQQFLFENGLNISHLNSCCFTLYRCENSPVTWKNWWRKQSTNNANPRKKIF